MADRTAYRVLVHLDDGERPRHEAALRTIANLLDDLGAENIQVEVVAHGPGLDLLTGETGLAVPVIQLVARGVALVACRNTLRARQLSPDHLLPHVALVPSGIGELVRRQAEGWLYIRP